MCVSFWIFADVGMMMMQSGMVKQTVNTYRVYNGTDIQRIRIIVHELLCLHKLTILLNKLGLKYYAKTRLKDTSLVYGSWAKSLYCINWNMLSILVIVLG